MELYSEPISVRFDDEPLLEKKPGAPDAFIWRKKTYTIISVEKEWHNYEIRGKMDKFYRQKRGNAPEMRPRKGGSWGIGKDYYQVKTVSGETFIIYYDRQPTKSNKGKWVLLQKVK